MLAVGPLLLLIIETQSKKKQTNNINTSNSDELQWTRKKEQNNRPNLQRTSQKAELYNLSSLLVLIFNKIYSL